MYEVVRLAAIEKTEAPSISEQYAQVQGWCVDQFGTRFCQGVLPQHPIWLPPDSNGGGLAWYSWLAIGLILGKVF